MEILAIIPARANSKRLKGKNLRNFCGKPLIVWTIEAAKKSRFITRTIVSTEDKKIAGVATKAGAEVPFMRPQHLATDSASTLAVIKHAIYFLKELDYFPDFICLLQPTSPLRTARDIDNAFQLVFSKLADACISVSEAKLNPFFSAVIKDNMYVNYFNKNARSYLSTLKPEKTYLLNGAIYIIKTDVFMEEKTFEPKNTAAYLMDNCFSIDIDTLCEFKIAEFIMKNKRLFKKRENAPK